MQTEQPPRVNLYLVFSLICLALINMQDGFDILAIAYTSHAIKSDWKLSDGQFGVVLSAGLLGMALGAVFLASFADKFGRKVITVCGLAISGAGMLVAMTAPNVETLIAGRIITGVGVGGILASLNTLAAEYAGDRFRARAVATFQLGFSLGAFFAGYIVAWLLSLGDGPGSWRLVFAFGAFSSFAFIPIMAILPESTAFIARKNGVQGISRINAIRRRFGRPEIRELHNGDDRPKLGFAQSLRGVLSPNYIVRTLLIWSAFFLLLMTLYFMVSQTPNVVQIMGFSDADGNLAGRLLNICGVFGIVVIAVLGGWLRPSLITSIYLMLLAAALIYFSSSAQNLSLILILVGVFGALAHGSMIGLYSTVSSLYPAHLRATGTGLAIGMSRYGAVIGPALAGYLLDAGWHPTRIFGFFAGPSLVAAGIACGLWWYQRTQIEQIED